MTKLENLNYELMALESARDGFEQMEKNPLIETLHDRTKHFIDEVRDQIVQEEIKQMTQ